MTTLLGCARGLSSIAPVGFRPADRARVVAWIDELAPKAPRLYEVRPWRYRNEKGAVSGRASIRVAPPDSLRFDYRAIFGRSGSAVIVGDTTLWVTGGDDFEGIVTFVALFWTALGLPQMPPETASVFDLVGDDFRAWRYIMAGDTLDFVLSGSPAERLEGEIRRQGVVLGQVRVELDTQTGLALRSQIDFWNVSRFELTMNSVDTLANFDSTTWKKQ